MDNSILIRALAIADYDALIALWQRAGLSFKPKGRDAREKVAKEMAANPRGFLGMFVDGRLIASVLATFDGRKGWINRLAVDPDFRGSGHGVRMIAEAENVLHDHFAAEIIAALVEPENELSKQLFAKCGYALWDGLHYFTKREHPDV